MKLQELKDTLNALDKVTKQVTMETAFDDIVYFFSLVNHINDNITKEELKKIKLKGRGKFLFIPQNEENLIAEICRNALIKSLNNAERNNYGMNRNNSESSKHTTYCGDIHGIWTNTVAYFENINDMHVKNTIAHQLYKYIKSFNNIFNPHWIR